MALFSLCKKLSLSRPFKIIYSEFHTLRKLENISFTRRNLPPIAPKRNYFWIFKKRTKREVRALDKPPDSYQLIYRHGIDNYFLVAQYGSFFMSVTVALIAVYNSAKWPDGETGQLKGDGEMSRPNTKYELLGLFSGFVFIICIFHFYMVRMPMRIYYHPQRQKYLMYFYGIIPNQIKKQVVYVSEFQALPNKGLLWSDITYTHTNGQKIVLLDNYFRHPADLYIMLGLQKDPDVDYEKIEDKK